MLGSAPPPIRSFTVRVWPPLAANIRAVYPNCIVRRQYWEGVNCNHPTQRYAVASHMNNHIYSTLFKIQERKSDRRNREIEQRKELQNTHIKQGIVTLIYCINIKSPSSLNGLEKYIFKYLIKICLKNWLASSA